MNCNESYEDIESIKEVESAIRPVSGRGIKRDPTQKLQECVERSLIWRIGRVTDR